MAIIKVLAVVTLKDGSQSYAVIHVKGRDLNKEQQKAMVKKYKLLQSLFEDSPIRLELIDWDGTSINNEIIEQGVYIVAVAVRSLNDGSKNRSYTKLVMYK